MKKELMRSLCKKGGLLLIAFLIGNTAIFSQTRQSKTLEETVTVKKGATININHQYGEVIIKSSSSDNLKARLDAFVEGKNGEDVEGLLSNLDLKILGGGSSNINLKTSPKITNWSDVNGKISIKLDNRQKFRGIKKVHFDLILEVPNDVSLNVKNKYNNISIEGVNANMDIENYDGNVALSNVKGDLKMTLKYGQAAISNIGNCDIEMYESRLTLSNARNFKLNSKYSEHTISNIDEGEFEVYEGEFAIGNINGDIIVNDRYSDWNIGTCNNITLESYEGDWNVGTMKDLETNSKECDFNIGIARVINLKKSYEDDVELGTVDVFESDKGKYLDVNIGTLKKGIYLMGDYESEINVKNVLPTFEGATLDGKETEFNVALGNKKFQLDVDIVESDLKVNRSTSRKGVFDLDTDDGRVKAKEMMNGATTNSPKVLIKGYELEVNLK